MGASRTDAGVHTRGQVVRIRTGLELSPEKLVYVLNRFLPPDITIVGCSKVGADFHPQHGVVRKTYSYTFSLSKNSPMVARYCYAFPHPHKLDLEILSQALQVFVGTHDFRSFCKEETTRTTIRTIERITLEQSSPCKQMYTITVVGPSFLRYMIRRIVGASLVVASCPEVSIDDLRKQLAGLSQCVKLLITAPAKGLCLESIEYQNGE